MPSPPDSPPDSPPPTIPLPLTASLHLSSLPPDASLALSLANQTHQTAPPSSFPPIISASTTTAPSTINNPTNSPTNNPNNDANAIPEKVTIRFQAVGSAPQLSQKTFKVSSGNRFESVVGFLGRKLAKSAGGREGGGKGEGGGGGGHGGVFCYVNSVFAPGLDEGVGGLWRCFKTDDQLIVAYSMTPAFG